MILLPFPRIHSEPNASADPGMRPLTGPVAGGETEIFLSQIL